MTRSQHSPATTGLAQAIEDLLTRHVERCASPEPEWLSDRLIRARFFGGISRTTYWQITKRPDFPRAREVSTNLKMRNVAAVKSWLADQERPA
jgi:hypothetical protein